MEHFWNKRKNDNFDPYDVLFVGYCYKPVLLFTLYMFPWEIYSGNKGLAFTVMLMILSSTFLHGPMKHTKLINVWNA